MSQHPSYLELDRHALGVSSDPATARHVQACERCRRHLSNTLPAEHVPAWVSELPPVVLTQRRLWAGVGTGLAIAAALCLIWLREPAYDSSKGSPSVGVYVHHEHTVALWDGKALAPGDQIRLEVAPEEFDHVAVLSLPDERQAPLLLYQGALAPHTRVVLPKAWQLDNASRAERLVVMFSHMEISADAAAALLHAREPREVQLVRLTLPKQTP